MRRFISHRCHAIPGGFCKKQDKTVGQVKRSFFFVFDTDPHDTRHGFMLLWFTDLMNVTGKFTIHRLKVSTLLSSAFIRGYLNAATRGRLGGKRGLRSAECRK